MQGERADLIRHAIKQVEAKSGIAPGSVGTPVVDSSDSRMINVLVEVADNVEVGPEAVVFIFARAISGPPAPLAALRLVRSELPKMIRLDESMAMIPGMSLANFDEVQVIARISSTGTVAVTEGDFEARSGAIDLTGQNQVIKLTIKDRVAVSTQD